MSNKIYAVIRDDVVIQTVTANSIESVQVFYPENLVVESSDETFPASVGFLYLNNKFYPPKPYPSWVAKDDVPSWKAPVDYPLDEDEKEYGWNEAEEQWEPLDNLS